MKKSLCPKCPELKDCPHADNRTKCWEYERATDNSVKRFLRRLFARLGFCRLFPNDKWYHPLYRRFWLARALVWKWELRKFPAWFDKIKGADIVT